MVYPNQGVCSVVGVEVQEIAGQKLELVRMRREEDGAAVMIPKGKVALVGLRRVASGELIEGVFHYLAAQYDDPELDWKVRHRDNADRLVAGGVLGVAEVVKGLHALSRIRPLPTKERELYDSSRHLLVGELAVSLGVAPGLAEDYVDHALMPPAGTRFNLKPPPKPILLPSRPKKRRLVVDDEGTGLEGLGLDDLAIDLLGAEGAGVEAAEGAEGAEASEGAAGGETPGPEGEDAAPAPPPPVPAPKKGARIEPAASARRPAVAPPARPAAPGAKPVQAAPARPTAPAARPARSATARPPAGKAARPVPGPKARPATAKAPPARPPAPKKPTPRKPAPKPSSAKKPAAKRPAAKKAGGKKK
jgi:RNA polymerase-interacting CarD/CdnL/TRCF family regulator